MLENEVTEVIEILNFIRDIPGSNFGLYIKCYDLVMTFSCSFQFLQTTSWTVL